MIRKIINFLRWKLRGEVPTEHLIRMGLKVGSNFSRQQGCVIDYSHCWLISIGDNVTLAPNVHLLAHDASTKMFLNYAKIGRIDIGDNVFVGANTTILPGVRIGNNVIIGAGSVVSRDIPEGRLVVGNPAKVICTTEEYLRKNRELMKQRPLYDEKWTLRGGITDSQKKQMLKSLENDIGYVE